MLEEVVVGIHEYVHSLHVDDFLVMGKLHLDDWLLQKHQGVDHQVVVLEEEISVVLQGMQAYLLRDGLDHFLVQLDQNVTSDVRQRKSSPLALVLGKKVVLVLQLVFVLGQELLVFILEKIEFMCKDQVQNRLVLHHVHEVDQEDLLEFVEVVFFEEKATSVEVFQNHESRRKQPRVEGVILFVNQLEFVAFSLVQLISTVEVFQLFFASLKLLAFVQKQSESLFLALFQQFLYDLLPLNHSLQMRRMLEDEAMSLKLFPTFNHLH